MKISVVIPLYNKRTSVLRALNSVLDQTIQPYEIIVVNDGSTDGSEQIVDELNHPLVRLFNQPNTGVSAARNSGIEEAKGDWIAFLDADDEWLPEYLKSIIFLSEEYPSCSVLATSYIFQEFTGVRRNVILRKLPFHSEHGILTNYFEIAAFSHPPICSSAVVVNKAALNTIGGFPKGVKAGEDLLTWARLAVRFNIAYSTKLLSVFHVDPSHSISENPSRLPDINDFVGGELKKIFDSTEGKLKTDVRKYLSLWYKMRASVYLRNNERSKVWKNSLKSLKYNILNYKNYLFIGLSLMPHKFQKLIARIYTS